MPYLPPLVCVCFLTLFHNLRVCLALLLSSFEFFFKVLTRKRCVCVCACVLGCVCVALPCFWPLCVCACLALFPTFPKLGRDIFKCVCVFVHVRLCMCFALLYFQPCFRLLFVCVSYPVSNLPKTCYPIFTLPKTYCVLPYFQNYCLLILLLQ